MGSRQSKARQQSIPTATGTDTVPVVSGRTPQDSRIPNEVLDEILKHLIADSGSCNNSLRSCSLVSKSWVPSCRRHLFHTIIFTPRDVTRWLKTFPVPKESPAHYVKDLRFSLGGHYGAPEKFSKHTPWFTNVEKMALTMNTTSPASRTSFPARLPQSVTSLTIKAGGSGVGLVQMRDIMARLPNLNDLILSGPFVVRSKSKKRLPGLGATLRGRFGGELQIRSGYTDEHIVNMLLEIPAGLHFTKLHVHADRACLLQTVRLAEACCKTLVNLLFSCAIYFDGRETFERSFDFSEFPRLQAVTFGLHLAYGPLHYIPVALSTLNPSTSPHLSYVHLRLTGPTHPNFTSGNLNLENLGDGLPQIAEEFSRIGREYKGAVDLRACRGAGFERYDTLNVLQRWDR